MTDNNPEQDWHDQAGLADETTSARIYPTRRQKKRWETEKPEELSLSRYIISLVEEARLERSNEAGDTDPESDKEKEQLKNRVQELEALLQEQTPEDDGDTIAVDQETVLQCVDSTPKQFHEILQQVIENTDIQKLLGDSVENQLYSLAENGDIRFNRRGGGWQIREEGDQ